MSEAVHVDYMRILTNPGFSSANGVEKLFQKGGIEILLLEGFDYLSGVCVPASCATAQALPSALHVMARC